MKNGAAVLTAMTAMTAPEFHTILIDERLAFHFRFQKCSASVFSEAVKYAYTDTVSSARGAWH